MMCDVSNKSVTTSGNMSNTVNHCQSSHMWSDSIVKEQKTGDLFSEYTLMCRRTELPCLYFFFFDKASLSRSCSYFRCDGCVCQTGFAVMAAAPTWASCLESTKRLSRSLVESAAGSQGISRSLYLCTSCCQGRLFPGVWGETITASDYITARRSARRMDFGFIAIFGTTLRQNWWHSVWQRRLKSVWWLRLLCPGDTAY